MVMFPLSFVVLYTMVLVLNFFGKITKLLQNIEKSKESKPCLATLKLVS